MNRRIPRGAASAALVIAVLAGGAAVPAIVSTAAVASDGGHITPGETAFRAAVIHQIKLQLNDFRAEQGLEPLVGSSALDDIAQPWTDHMAETDEFKHNPNFGEQVFATGATGAAENIAGRSAPSEDAAATAAALVNQWKNSPGHRANMLGTYNGVGVGFAVAANGYVYATQVFGLYPGEVPSPNAPANFPEPPENPTTDPAEDPSDDPSSDAPTATPTETDDAVAEFALTVTPEVIDAADFVDREKGVRLEVAGLEPGEQVTFTVTPAGDDVTPYETTITADENGVASWRVYGTSASDPKVYVGEYSVVAANEAGEQLTGAFSVVSGEDGQPGGEPSDEGTPGDDGDRGRDGDKPGELPRTGAGLAGLGAGVALLTVGGATVLLTRRRSA